jgi:hypothetical protein
VKLIGVILAELASLFVDDGSLALQVLVLVLGVAALVKGAGLGALAGALAVLVGCLLILGLSLNRAKRR